VHKQQYFRVPYSRLKKTGRALYREALSELQEDDEVVCDRRSTRLTTRKHLRTVCKLSPLGGRP
jgi:hypothetical protein